MIVSLSFIDIWLFILISLSATLCIFMILMAFHVTKFVKRINAFADVNGDTLSKTITQIQELTMNVNSISRRLGYGIDSVGATVGSLNSILLGTVSAVGSGTASVIDLISVVRKLITNGMAIMHKHRKSKK